MHTSVSFASLVALILLSWTTFARAAIEGLERVASGLAAPIFVTHAPGDTSRLFIAQRAGQIRILDLTTGALQATPFLSTTVDTNGEGGLLGLAFHPDYSNVGMPGFGKFYVDVTTGSPFTIRVREFQVSANNANVANPGTMREIVSVPHTAATNHNGGWIGFSPNDKFLYVATGDGGGGNDDGSGHTPGIGNAQDTTNNLLGKMLRIDVNGDDFPTDSARNYAIPPTNPFKAGVGIPGDDVGDDEIWGYGLRNPFRASFDRQTGDLWIGDVGQGQREEIDFQPANSDGGENYGWRLREGLIQTPGVGGAKPPDNVDPVYDYNRDNDQFGGTVVSGGYVYRGPDPDLRGKYFFLDSRNTAGTGDDNYWMFDPANPFGTVDNIDALLTRDVGSGQFPVSFGEDALGNLYIAYIGSGEVYRIETSVVPVMATWNVDSDGVWSLGSNWTGGVAPNGVGHTATLGAVITANRTITLDSPQTVGALTFADGNSYTLVGPGLLTLSNTGGASITVGIGSHTISAPVTLSDNTILSVQPAASNLTLSGTMSASGSLTKTGDGTLTVNNVRAEGLTISGGTVTIAPNGTNAGASNVGRLTLNGATDAWTAKLDMNDNDAVVRSTAVTKAADVARLYNQLQQGYADGNWNGQGITSSAAANNTNLDTGLALVDNAALGRTDFSGQTVNADSILLKYTYYGDIDLNGQVDGEDLTTFALNFGRTTGMTQVDGDIDFNGRVDGEDLTVFALNFNKGIGSPLVAGSVEAVPEPASLVLAGLAALIALTAVRTKHYRFCAAVLIAGYSALGASTAWANVNSSGDVAPVPPVAGGAIVGPFRIGNTDVGTMTITTSGGVSPITNSGPAIIGDTVTGLGIANLSGFGSDWGVTSSLADMTVGLNGTGSLNLSNLASVSVNDDLFVAAQLNSSGRISIASLGTILTVGDDANIGQRGQAGIDISNGGRLVSDQNIIGDELEGDGRVTVSDQLSLWRTFNSMTVADAGRGLLQVFDGARVENTSGTVAFQAGSTGTVEVVGLGSLWQNSTNLFIGEFGHGTLSVRDGGRVVNGLFVAPFIIGRQIGSVGEAEVRGLDSEIIVSIMEVGDSGDGTLRILEGGRVTSGNSILGDNANSRGVVVVDGDGSRWDMSGALDVADFGEAHLTISGGGVVHTSSVSRVAALGRITLDGGRLEIAGLPVGLQNSGVIEGNGTIEVPTADNGGRIRPQGPEPLLFTGTLNNSGLIDVQSGILE